MLKRKKSLVLILLLVMSLVTLAACTTKVENTQSTNERGYENPGSIVTASELKAMEDVAIVDFTKSGGEYIPGAVRITREEARKEVNGVPGMNISKEEMEALLSKSGIENDDIVVIYDEDNNLWASRLWWAMKVYGHEDVKLLDGGLNAWKSAEYATEKDLATPEATDYKATAANEALVADLDLIKTTYDNEAKLVLDTRSDGEWKDGHIPGAVHLEWNKALNEDGTFKNAEELKALYEGAGITADKEGIMPHCKTGVRATHSMFVLQELLGYDNVKNYDGSWVDFEASGEPIEK